MLHPFFSDGSTFLLRYLPYEPDQVLAALREGKVSAVLPATEQMPDFFLHYALDSGLLEQLANSFPDPRNQQPEIPPRLLLAAGIAGHFAGLYALSQLPYALHSPKLLTLLGVQVVVQEPGNGLSRKGTQDDKSFHGDVVRKLLDKIAASDIAAKRLPGQTLIDWYNKSVGESFCQVAEAKPRLHILDCTDLVVPLSNQNYEQSGVTKKNDTPQRGYKLATLRSLLEEKEKGQGAILTAIGWGQIQDHDLTVTADLVRTTPHLHEGDTLLEDRGFIDAVTITFLKIERKVNICTGLKKDMLLFKSAIVQANANPGSWEAHPTRNGQQIQRVEGILSLWQGLKVPINVCVVRFQNKTSQNQDDFSYLGFATTDLTLSARQIIEMYQRRTDIEEDYRQLKSASWQINSFVTTRLVQILWHVCLTLIAYNLFQVYANTKVGRDFAGKTKQKIEREQRRHPVVQFLVCTPYAYGVFEASALLYLMLDLPEDVRQRIRNLLKLQIE